MNKQVDYKLLSALATKSEADWKHFLSKNKKKLETMDLKVHSLHYQISEQTDCLACANCCRTLGPRITDKDVDKIAKYLQVDEDGDTVFQSMPCVFLGADNYCAIYESRPKACKEYPHTDRKRFYQIFNLSIKNAYNCPIVYSVLEELKKM